MKIKHRIAESTSNPFFNEIKKMGISFDESSIISVLTILESSKYWPEVKQLMLDHKVPSQVLNIFSTREIRDAQWFILKSRGHHGYPQPDSDFGFIESTYDTNNFCKSCGIGGKQKAAFRINKNSTLQKKNFFQLNWVFDEFFVSTEVAKILQKKGLHGFHLKPIIHHKTNNIIESSLQIVVENKLQHTLQIENLFQVTCKQNNEESDLNTPLFQSYCGRQKFHPNRRGPLVIDEKLLLVKSDIIKTENWFGSGSSAFQEILISKKFADIISSEKWKGITLEPVYLQKAN
jgi:hypothetical protein